MLRMFLWSRPAHWIVRLGARLREAQLRSIGYDEMPRNCGVSDRWSYVHARLITASQTL